MMYLNRHYPDIFPEGCPPEDSKIVRKKVYRLINGDIISSEDFKSFKELGRDARSEKYPFIEYGLSVNADYEELRKCWRGTPALKKRCKNISSGVTYECTGVLKETPSKAQKSHHTWWIYKEIDPSNFFSIEGGESHEG